MSVTRLWRVTQRAVGNGGATPDSFFKTAAVGAMTWERLSEDRRLRFAPRRRSRHGRGGG